MDETPSRASGISASLTWREVVARRMARQALSSRAADRAPADIASLLCGVHAQVPSAAELSVGRRIAGATRSDIQHALSDERSLIKTFGPRGTVHLIATVDLPMWTGAWSALPSTVPTHPEPVRFSAAEAEEVIAAIGDALANAELTVDELTEAIRERAGAWAVERTMEAFQDRWPRWRQLTSIAAHRGLLCFGTPKGRNVTYTSPQRWLPGFRPVAGPAALRRLVAQYLHAYGPATAHNFASWLGIPSRRAVALFDELADGLELVDVDGQPGWTLAGDTRPADVALRAVCLLPYFDAYVVAGQPRARLFPGSAVGRALTPSGQAGNFQVMLVDGVVAGIWQQRRSGGTLSITVETFQELTRAQRRMLDDEVDLVGSVMETKTTLTIGPVTVGAHA